MFFRIDEITKSQTELEDWCTENLNGIWHLGNSTMWIENDDDAMAFKLRWL